MWTHNTRLAWRQTILGTYGVMMALRSYFPQKKFAQPKHCGMACFGLSKNRKKFLLARALPTPPHTVRLMFPPVLFSFAGRIRRFLFNLPSFFATTNTRSQTHKLSERRSDCVFRACVYSTLCIYVSECVCVCVCMTTTTYSSTNVPNILNTQLSRSLCD